jgi:serine/threonine-protein kinase
MLGTPYYMAPEQASGEVVVDHRADVWSIGVILYECLSGTRPIEGENLPQVVSRLMSAGIIPLERLAPQLPHDVTAIVMQMLSRDPLRRPDGLREVSTVLSRYSRAPVPEFTDPARASLLPAPPVATQRPKARVVGSGDADPQGPTMLSAPPVNQSVNTERPPEPQRKVPIVLFGAAGFVLVLIWFAFVRSSSPPTAAPAAAPSTEASALAAPPSVPVAVASAAPLPSASAAPGAKAHSSIASSSMKPHGGGVPPRVDPSPKPTRDDDTLFSGRK